MNWKLDYVGKFHSIVNLRGHITFVFLQAGMGWTDTSCEGHYNLAKNDQDKSTQFLTVVILSPIGSCENFVYKSMKLSKKE